MEYLWRHPHALAHVERARAAQPSSFFSPRQLNGHQRTLLGATLAIFLAHVLVLARFPSQPAGQFLSNVLQLLLGVAAFLALLDAARRSQRTARWIWFYAAAGLAAYTLGQLIFIGYDVLGLGPGYTPRISDQFFFFWVAPLLAAAAIDTLGQQDGFDGTTLLDFTQLLILGIVLHVFVFADSSRWQTHVREMEFLKLKARLVRDALVLGCLWSRAWLTRSEQTRALFARLGLFYLAYSVSDAVYLYTEARWDIDPGTWLDLLWSFPRVLIVVLALSWKWQDAPAPRRAAAHPRFHLCLRAAPAVVPLALVAISFRTFSSAPVLWATLMIGSFAVASLRLMAMQQRQEQTLTELHNSNELLHSIIEGTSEAVYLKDPDGRYKLINTAGARYLGLTPEQVLGRTDRELLTPETVSAIAKMDGEVLSKGQSITCEEALIQGVTTRTFLSTKNPYRDSQGRVVGVLGISVDITEHRRMEDQLRRAQRMESIGAFSGAIAHDFSNLLTVIKGYGQLALNELNNHSAVQTSVEQIVKATDRAAKLIRQLLAFGRQQELQPRVLSLNDVICHVEEMLRRLIERDIEIVTRFAASLWLVKADPGQIEQVLMNLAANAVDAMPQGGKLILETGNIHLDEAYARANVSVEAGDYAAFFVRDTGTGMDATTRARIFEPFFTTKPVGKGTGLGLATVYGIVKQSGGYITVESEPGEGTTFAIYLPRVDQPLEYVPGCSSA